MCVADSAHDRPARWQTGKSAEIRSKEGVYAGYEARRASGRRTL